MNSHGTRLRIGHTPDADDAFMFYGFASGQVSIPGYEIVHVLHDIETLNALASGEDPLEVTALSLAAFFHLRDRYELLEVGSSVGRGYGPRVVADHPMQVSDLEGARIALPGRKTTATLAAKLLLPQFEAVQVPFTEVPARVLRGEVDAGVVIHESQLTYSDEGLHLVCDLGQMFAERYAGLPLPLGVNCVRRDQDDAHRRVIAAAYRRSIEIAVSQREAAVKYSARYGRGASTATLDRFVGMYVNDDSLSLRDEVRSAIEILAGQAGARI
jgi:1,4-dihydroxy-6-naphthoate synthase